MNKLSNYLVEQVLLEESVIKDTVVVYVGRFQPMHKGHFLAYKHLTQKFGKKNVFIGTSNKTEKGRSPFNFKEKKQIMTTMFPIPKNKVVKVKNPYAPTEVLKKFNKNTTAFITVVGEKDASRLSHKYFQKWDGNPTEGYEDRGYLYIVPKQGGGISGTEVRNGLSLGSDEQKEKFFKDSAYGKFNKTIFNMVTDRLNEGLFISKERIEEYIMNEVTMGALTGADVDDGPNFFTPNYKTFKKVSAARAAKLGWTVLNMIGDEKFEDYYEHPKYPKGPQSSVSYFPAGVIGTMTANNQVDIYSSNAYSQWFTHVTRKAALVGYEVVKGVTSDKDDKETAGDDARGAKKIKKEFEASLTEAITLPVEIGDVILVGRFKNKKMVVKNIGVDDHGMPTINGRKVVNFRFVKEGFNVDFDDVKFTEDMPLDEKSRGRLRPADLLRRKAAMAGKGAAIARKRKRTMMRKKPLTKLKKIAYKMAYRQVYAEFMKDLYPDIKNRTGLSIAQAKVVHKNVLRKKGRVMKRAKFRFLPALRQKEAEKFGLAGPKDENLGYPGKKEIAQIKKRVDNQRNNTDSNEEYQYDKITEVNEFFYMDFKKYVWRRRGEINRKLKGVSPKQKKEFLEKLWKKAIGKGFGKDADGKELHTLLKKDKYIRENEPVDEETKRDYKDEYKKFQSSTKSKKYRAELNKYNRDKGTYGNGDGKDASHKGGKIVGFEKESKNRGRREKSRLKKNKPIKENEITSEGRPIPMDTPNELVYLDFKKYAYKNRSMFKKELLKNKDNGGKMFLTLSALWYKWARKDNKEFTHIKDKLKFGRALMIMMVQDDVVFSKKAWKKDNKITHIKEELISEGGAYGHMAHPFDTDINLTFGQLKDIVNRALDGELDFTTEKTDGQALAISWKDGRLVAARNKGHLKNKGENALDIRGVSDKFQGRGGLSDAYNFAMKDLSKAVSSLSDKQRQKVFKDGACFMNLEVIYPTSVNVITYGQALLIFHGTMEYDDDGNAIGEDKGSARTLAGMIKQVNKDVQDNYTIQGPPVVKLPKSQKLSSKKGKYNSKISKLQKEFGLKDTDGVAVYHQAWWSQWVDKNSPSTLDNKTKMGLVKRWAFYDKGFRLDKRNITDEKTLEWSKKIDKQDQVKISKKNIMKFEQIFLGLGAEVLEFTSSALTVNPDKAIRDIKKRIDKTIKDVKKSGDPKKIEKLKLELQRLNSIGGAKKIVPNEGIVFQYKGKTFKLTGTFASVNQILGIFF